MIKYECMSNGLRNRLVANRVAHNHQTVSSSLTSATMPESYKGLETSGRGQYPVGRNSGNVGSSPTSGSYAPVAQLEEHLTAKAKIDIDMVRSLIESGQTTAMVAKSVGCYQSYVSKICKRHGIDSSRTARRRRLGLIRSCLECKKEIIGKRGKFCSMYCYEKNLRDKSQKKLIQNSFMSDSSRRKAMLRMNGKSCAICKTSTWNGRDVPLVMDHINGNSQDNSLENLRMICPNCDALLPTYKGRNAGRGRFSRRQRYRDGKSY